MCFSITKGTKQLTFPQISRSFVWNGPEVISNSSQGCLYIMAKINPASTVFISDDDDCDDLIEVLGNML